MSAEILTFPVPVEEQRVQLVKSETRDWQMTQLLRAAEYLDAARLELSQAANRLHHGGELTDDDPATSGQTLESALIAVVSITNLMGATNANRDVARVARVWLQVNGSSDDVG
ncbi:hypothetical protein [Rhizobium sp. LC145]|uniref:hypothetical protein n=1 Tax=Rhizobium sp. LC145 TaxID=1120688 RepID=UPI000629F4C3|nr:hypothetical protein [Rhizobium sp. LC145]KKX28251.1 hypothetical protein YH62_19390 [Rhizobium sp. LC145]TKT58328.1 hypothetical protein FDR95_12015 [Rhizobiaceae bacterium LC148]